MALFYPDEEKINDLHGHAVMENAKGQVEYKRNAKG